MKLLNQIIYQWIWIQTKFYEEWNIDNLVPIHKTGSELQNPEIRVMLPYAEKTIN